MGEMTFDWETGKYIDTPPEMADFLKDIEAVFEKHGFALVPSADDELLVVERCNDDTAYWLHRSAKRY